MPHPNIDQQVTFLYCNDLEETSHRHIPETDEQSLDVDFPTIH